MKLLNGDLYSFLSIAVVKSWKLLRVRGEVHKRTKNCESRCESRLTIFLEEAKLLED
jgi:hypothetical protein